MKDKLCPKCGKLLRPGWRRWFCDNSKCTVEYVLLSRDGSVKSVIYTGIDIMGII